MDGLIPPLPPVIQIHHYDIHEGIRRSYATFLGTSMGERLVAAFEQSFPGFPVTRVKMLDLVLWQQRDA